MRAYPRPAIGMVHSRITETAEQARRVQEDVLKEIRKIDGLKQMVNIGPFGLSMTVLPRDPNWVLIKAALCEVYSRMWCEEHNVGACMAVAPDAVTSNYLASVLLSGADEERDA